MDVKSRAGRIRELLRERDFRRLLAAQLVAQAADGFAQAALANELILEPSGGTAARLLGVIALTLLPYSVIAPFLGVFVDRWPRRALLSWTNVVRGIGLLVYAAIGPSADSDVVLMVGALVLLGIGRLFLTTKGASLPFVLHEHHLLRGNALSAGGGMISALGGGVLGVFAVSNVELGPALGMAGAIYLVSAVAARRLSDPMAHAHPPAESLAAQVAAIAAELKDGIGQVWARPRVRIPMASVFILRTIAMITALAAILVIKNSFESELGDSALALGAAGTGAFIGAVATPLLGTRLDEPRLVVLGFVVAGAGIAVLGGIESLPVLLVLTATGGFGNFVTKVSVDSLVQEGMPDAFRGRAFALYDILYNAASVIAAALLLPFEDSLRPMLIATGLGCLLLARVVAVAMKRAGVLTPRVGGPPNAE